MQTQAQAPSPHYSPPTLEQFILDHEQRLTALVTSNEEIVGHLNQLGRLRQQQRSEYDREISDLRSQIVDLKSQVSTPRSWVVLSLAGVVGVALLSATSTMVQNHQLAQMEAKIYAHSTPAPNAKTHKN